MGGWRCACSTYGWRKVSKGCGQEESCMHIVVRGRLYGSCWWVNWVSAWLLAHAWKAKSHALQTLYQNGQKSILLSVPQSKLPLVAGNMYVRAHTHIHAHAHAHTHRQLYTLSHTYIQTHSQNTYTNTRTPCRTLLVPGPGHRGSPVVRRELCSHYCRKSYCWLPHSRALVCGMCR